jgi:hypothetical protein
MSRSMRHPALLAVLLAVAAPAAAQPPLDSPAPPPVPPSVMEDLQRAEEAMRRGLEHMMESVDILLRAVPQYDLPTVNENGDIIIRRRQPEPGRGLAPRRSSDII